MEDDEDAILCYGWDAVSAEWLPIRVDDTGTVETTS